jgi:E3 SUMO-protein ligase PIAS1
MAPSLGVPAIPRRDSDPVIRKVMGSILNRHLSTICQLNGLKSTGVKADMQQRIVNRESCWTCLLNPFVCLILTR